MKTIIESYINAKGIKSISVREMSLNPNWVWKPATTECKPKFWLLPFIKKYNSNPEGFCRINYEFDPVYDQSYLENAYNFLIVEKNVYNRAVITLYYDNQNYTQSYDTTNEMREDLDIILKEYEKINGFPLTKINHEQY